MEIKSTTAYELFSYVKGNRPITKMHVSMLIRAINNKNLLHLAPILVNKSFQVIDGQHRLEAAKNLKTPIYYMMAADASSNEAKVLNSVVNKWTMKNFVNSYAEKGKTDYIKLRDFSTDYSMAATNAAMLLNTSYLGKSGGRGSLQAVIKKGDFKIANYDLAETIAEELNEASKYCKRNFCFTREFMVAYTIMRKQIKPNELLEALKKTNTLVEMKASYGQYLELFEQVYYKAYKKSIHFN